MASTITQINKINQIISENIEDPILILNEKFMCEYANFEDFKEEKHIFDFIHPDDKKRVNKFIKNIFKHGFGTEESRIIDDKGFFRWYEIKGKRFLDDTNNRRVFLICRDISKFKKIEENYNESQKSFSELADSLPEIRYWKFIQSKEGVTTVQKTREMLDLVCDNIPHFIYWKDINLVYIGCNKNFALMNGLEEGSNIIGRTDNDLIWLKNNIETIQENERRVMKNNIPELNSVASFITKDGNQVWFEINRIPLHDLKGKVVGILSTYEDITIRKTAEEKLKESEEKYRGILDTIKEGYFEVDINGKFTFFNDALCELHGYTNEEMLGVNYQTFVDETNKQKIIEVYTEVYQTGNPKFDFQYQLRNKNGELITCETSIYLRHDINGKIVGFSGFLRDITEKFILEQKIKESEENYRTIFNSSPDYIYVTDVEGNLLEANQSLLDRIGIPLEELRETNFMQYFAGDDLEGLMEISQGLTLGKEIKGIEVRAKNVHGEIFEYEINAVPLKTNGEITKVLNLARDITAKKYAEQRLKDSEKKYRHLFESSPYSIWLMDEDGIIVDCNSTINSLLSVLKIEDIIGKKFSEVLTFLERPDDLIILLKERFDKFLKGDRLGPLEFQITRLNGIKIWLSIQTSIVNIGGKRLTQAIIQDITDLKESEEELRILNEELEQIILERTKELRESEEKYRTLTEQSFLGIAIVQDDIVQYVNNQLANKFGYTVQEIMAWKKGGFLNIIYPEDRKLVAEQARKKQLGESDVTNQYQFRGIKKNGDIIWLETFSKTINYRGKPADFATVIDISDRIFAEQKLMESERKFRHLYENSPYGIVLLNSEGTIIDINSTVPMMFGFDKKDLIGNNYFTLIGVYSSDTMSTLRELPAVLSRRRTLDSNVIPKITEIYKKDGTRTWVQSEISTIELDDEIIHQVIIQDITEKFKLEQELLESEKKLREQNIELMKLDQIKNDFITMAAHELKTPLISISGYTDYILMKHRTSFTPEITEDLLTVQRNVKRLEVLMDQLLEVMKIDEDKLELQKEQINVRMIINDCLDDLSYLINEKNLEIILNINHEITLNVDTTRIFTVFTNLISNAIKFTPDYGWVEISAEKSKDGYIFKVKDNGIGLNEEELGKLFKKFERIKQPILNENSNVKDNGTGLGLYITKGIVELHGGEIHADSEGPNKGTTFTFTLPI